MAGSPRYLELLTELEPLQNPVNYVDLDVAWDTATTNYDTMANFYDLAEVALTLVAQDVQTYRVERDLSGAWEQVTGDAKELHIAKNAGYAGADATDPWINFRGSEDFGIPAHMGVLIRMTDKYIRIQNLLRDPDNDRVGESILDTLRDLAAYALIYICIWEEGI